MSCFCFGLKSASHIKVYKSHQLVSMGCGVHLKGLNDRNPTFSCADTWEAPTRTEEHSDQVRHRVSMPINEFDVVAALQLFFVEIQMLCAAAQQ